MSQSSLCARQSPRTVAAIGMLMLLVCLGGCSGLVPKRWKTASLFSVLSGPGGELTINSVSKKDVLIKAGFEHGIYTTSSQNTATIILYDGTLEDPQQVLVIRMFWNPHAGKTPVDPTATNATMQYVIFPESVAKAGEADDPGDTGEADEADKSGKTDKSGKAGKAGDAGQAAARQVGIYSGAGYLYPNSDVGDKKFVASVWQGTLRISDQTDGFFDHLGQALMKGRFIVERDDLAIQSALNQLNIKIRQRLGKARLIQAEPVQSDSGETSRIALLKQ